ncbi:MAG: manganese efflux pump [Sedimentisphaerales bacterium]|nr:manganese efflux pump [Sedimentisphaerales bacterium]
MDWLTIIGLAFALAMDALAVSIAVGMNLERVTGRHVFRLAWHFGLFQFLMSVCGWLAGREIAAAIQAWDHWLAFGLLAFIGGKMIYEAFSDISHKTQGDPTRGIKLVVLSVATSLDALAVGLSQAFLGAMVWMAAVIIGLVAGMLTMLGIRFGARLGIRWGHRAELVGGVVLLLIGLRVLISHLVG